ncbi:hypothetical protein EW145_g2382 [Phellinidium pouzarii]|uniref:phosphatidylserine decarboxylase n=1 Tax=Phellinidium pouzarii TaxID=167371 RepID=A0A4S4LB51_9AGAM|nr:hypothetical protein EW145_g2382 [Phellinidium pouzarii]
MVGEKKVYKLKKALKTAARLPARARVSGGRGSGRNTVNPNPGELPVVILRVQIIGCSGLLAKDKNGTSDPFIVVSLARNRNSTPVAKKTVDPTYLPKDATFDFPVYLSLAGKLGVLELIVWDKDMLKKDYLGEASLQLENWFKDKSAKDFGDPNNTSFMVNIMSTRASTSARGSIRVKIGFVLPEKVDHNMNLDEIYDELVRCSRKAQMSLVSAPPTEGIGTIRAYEHLPAYDDDGLSSDEGSSEEDEDEHVHAISPASSPPGSPLDISSSQPDSVMPTSSSILPEVNVIGSSPTTPTIANSLTVPPPAVQPASKSKGTKIPRVFKKRPALTRALTDSPVASDATVAPSPTSSTRLVTPGMPSFPSSAKMSKFSRKWRSRSGDYNFNAANDILGIVMLDIQGATDLPKLKNLTRMGWDMDPFVVISFGKKVFRTRVIRHSLNPIWDEKLLFHVRRYETNFKIQLTVLDWDKLSSNDHVGDASFDLSELLKNAPTKDEITGLYPENVANSTNEMREFKLNLSTAKEMPWESKFNPVLSVRTGLNINHMMHFGNTSRASSSHQCLTRLARHSRSRQSILFFTRHGKNAKEEEITMSEAIQCLETELCRPTAEKRRLDVDDSGMPDTSTPATPMILGNGNGTADDMRDLGFENIDFSGPPVHPSAIHVGLLAEEPELQALLPTHPTEPSQQPLSNVTQRILDSAATRVPLGYQATEDKSGPERQTSSSASSDAEDSSGTNSDGAFERVINVKNCPLCHRPRMNSKAEVDIITHLAVCASQDWARFDRIVVGNFVTASQAQRKWYTKVISKVSSGNYKLGANSANIIVQNRMTGQLEEEKMQGAKSRMEGARARRLLKSLSIKQGIKYDMPESANDIPTFIQFHKLKVDEILEPINSFKTFNQFFYRKLNPDARPVEDPDDPTRLVSAADCRMMTFETVSEATRLWIKGREFTVARLLGDGYRDQADRYTGGALAIFRLAPQDYHRFHSPVDGKIGPMTDITGEYYTVNPQAIRTALDVYGENVRKIVPINSPTFGRVMAVCIGAMMVGSIHATVQEGEEVKRGQEFGYFAFGKFLNNRISLIKPDNIHLYIPGGSTIVCLFEKGMVEWDEDLLINGLKQSMANSTGTKTQELGTLVVVVLKAKNLPDKHTFTKQDPYAVIELGSLKANTNVDKRGGQHPVWDQDLHLKVSTQETKESRTLRTSCYAKEPKSDTLIGTGEVDISETLVSGEFDDWVKLEDNGAYRGEVYLEVTFFAAGPSALARRPSKLAPAERLWRPLQTPPKTPTKKSPKMVPQNLSPTRHPVDLGVSTSPKRMYLASPGVQDGPSLPSIPDEIPASLLPNKPSAPALARVGVGSAPAPQGIPEALRPGGPSKSVAASHHFTPSAAPSIPKSSIPAPTTTQPHNTVYNPHINNNFHHTSYNDPDGYRGYSSPVPVKVPIAAAAATLPFPQPRISNAPSTSSGNDLKRASENETFVPPGSYCTPNAEQDREREARLAVRYGSPMPLPNGALREAVPALPSARPPAESESSRIRHVHAAHTEVPDSYLEQERAALARARQEDADADLARRLQEEAGSYGIQIQSQGVNQDEADEEFARRLARELNTDVLKGAI